MERLSPDERKGERMKIKFLGAAHEVTGSCTLLEVNGKKILVDCGMEQGADIYENCELPVSVTDIDCVFLTHAHIDHSGKLPELTKAGFRGNIFATEATAELCRIMLLDSAHIQESEAEWRNRKAKRSGGEKYEPPYTSDDVYKTIPLFVKCKYSTEYNIYEGVSARFIDAGHLLGSSSIELTVTENGKTETILFSGDIGNVDKPLIRDPQKPTKADIVIIESTYGDRLHEKTQTDHAAEFAAVIQKTFDRGGNLIIPSFAVGRTQELLYLISQIKDRKLVRGHDGFPVWVDSPLAVEATGIYAGGMDDYYDGDTLALIKQGKNPLRFDGLNVSVTSEDSVRLNRDKTPKIIISASGMCEAGRIRHHLKHNIWRPECTILFVGYQAEGTLGRALVEGAKKIKLFGEEVSVNAQIEVLAGTSGHADRDMLLNWLGNIFPRPKKVFVNHGDDEVCDVFAQTINETFDIDATAPYNGAEYDLVSGECLYVGNRQKKEKKVGAEKGGVSAVYARLLQAGRRIAAVIEKHRHAANKDIAKLTDQINDLCKKWED